jgi:lysozyme
MTTQDRAALVQQLIAHEGLRLQPYRCTSGKLTILVGYNVDDRGLAPLSAALGRPVTMMDVLQGRFTAADAVRQVAADIDRIEREVQTAWPAYEALGGVRQRVVIDFVYNLGTARAAKFRSAIAFIQLAITQEEPALREACFTAAAFHICDSLWARQVDDGLAGSKGRADRLARMLRTGIDGGPAA